MKQNPHGYDRRAVVGVEPIEDDLDRLKVPRGVQFAQDDFTDLMGSGAGRSALAGAEEWFNVWGDDAQKNGSGDDVHVQNSAPTEASKPIDHEPNVLERDRAVQWWSLLEAGEVELAMERLVESLHLPDARTLDLRLRRTPGQTVYADLTGKYVGCDAHDLRATWKEYPFRNMFGEQVIMHELDTPSTGTLDVGCVVMTCPEVQSPYGSGDRAALAYGRADDGRVCLQGFALADGVSSGVCSNEFADACSALMAVAMAQLHVRQIALTADRGRALSRAIVRTLYDLNPKEELLAEQRRRRLEQEDPAYVEDLTELMEQTRDKDLGSATMFAGYVEECPDGKLVRFLDLGTYSAALLHPDGRAELYEMTRHVPEQLSLGIPDDPFAGAHVGTILIPKGSVLVVCTDGLQGRGMETLRRLAQHGATRQQQGGAFLNAREASWFLLRDGLFSEQMTSGAFDDASVLSLVG